MYFTGGAYNSKEGCQPYEYKPCNWMYGCEEIPEEPKCHHSCQKIDDKYSAEKTYGGKPYRIPPIEEDIQIEILMNGPVEASFKVYADLALYKGNENVYSYHFL